MGLFPVTPLVRIRRDRGMWTLVGLTPDIMASQLGLVLDVLFGPGTKITVAWSHDGYHVTLLTCEDRLEHKGAHHACAETMMGAIDRVLSLGVGNSEDDLPRWVRRVREAGIAVDVRADGSEVRL